MIIVVNIIIVFNYLFIYHFSYKECILFHKHKANIKNKISI